MPYVPDARYANAPLVVTWARNRCYGATGVAILAQQPGHSRDDRQARPIQSSFDGILHPRCLSAQRRYEAREHHERGRISILGAR